MKKPEDQLKDFASEAGAVLPETDLERHVRDFNERFYVVGDFGGKCAVCWESENYELETKTLTLGHQTFGDFKNRYSHEFVQVGTKIGTDGEKIPVFKDKAVAWLGSWSRRQYTRVAFAPGEQLPLDIHNLWRGFAFEPKKGACGLYLAHIKDNICRGDEKKYEWLLCWMAFKIRHPGLQGFTAVVLKGKEGIGKNMLAETFGKLFGSHYLCVTKREHVAGHFNAHLRACCLLIANEAFFAGDRQHQSSLKGLITDTFLMIEAKGVDAVASRNRLSIIMLSNEAWVVPAGPEARRYAVFDCGDKHREDTEYFGAIHKQLDAGGYAALLYYLLNEVDITKFDHHKALRTEALAEQQSQSLRGAEAMWFECLHRGELPGGIFDDGSFVVRSERLLTWARLQRKREWSEITAEQLGLLLGINPRGVSDGMRFGKTRAYIEDDNGNGDRLRVWKIPDLKLARETWNTKRFVVDWPGEDDEWEITKVGDERPAPKSKDDD